MDYQSIVDEINAGAYDEDGLSEIIDAVRSRFEENGSYWRIDFDGLDITEENLTVLEGKLVERAVGNQLRFVDPAASTTHAAAIVMAALIERRSYKPDAAEKSLKLRTAKELTACCTRYTHKDLDPKDSADGGSA